MDNKIDNATKKAIDGISESILHLYAIKDEITYSNNYWKSMQKLQEARLLLEIFRLQDEF